METLKTIPFSEIKKDLWPSIVWQGLTVKPSELSDVMAFFISAGLYKAGTIIDARYISGNVMGENGRSAVLFIFSPDTILGNVLARLSIAGLTWTEDFLDNCGEDYGMPSLFEIDEIDSQ